MRDDHLRVIAGRRADNMKLWLELMGMVDKVEMIRLALLADQIRARNLLAHIANNDEAIVKATRGLVDED